MLDKDFKSFLSTIQKILINIKISSFTERREITLTTKLSYETTINVQTISCS